MTQAALRSGWTRPVALAEPRATTAIALVRLGNIRQDDHE
jgi:hypothetical protein